MTEETAGTQPAQRYRFGVFEADVATGELRRKGLRVKLNTQPFQLLLMLLNRPGELVTREEIQRELWPHGTFVDFEHGVNSAVNRIREALGDTAANPRFLETLARRGYRFIAPVERVERAKNLAADESSVTGKASLPPITESREEPAADLDLQAEPPRRLRFQILTTPEDLPKSPPAIVQTLFALLQLMYLGFYVGALANLAEIKDLLSPVPDADLAYRVLIVTAAILIPVRAFVLCAALFHAPDFRGKFRKLWPFLFLFDELWSLAPFLLLHHINFGLALACTTLLVYSPFAQRSLVLMGAGETKRETDTMSS
jgi:DNA-binding winged helix-turn-helix (wHTH) protein